MLLKGLSFRKNIKQLTHPILFPDKSVVQNPWHAELEIEGKKYVALDAKKRAALNKAYEMAWMALKDLK